jgi:very-short-patch-repair endonuclease
MDGHSFGDQPRRHAARDALLGREGFRVLRIAARDVLKDMDAVLRFVLATCSEVGPLHHDAARRGPPPRSGEE